LTELTKNIDGYRLSTYFYKDKDSKDARLKMDQLGTTTWRMAMLIIMKDTKLQVGNIKSTHWHLQRATFICLLFGGQNSCKMKILEPKLLLVGGTSKIYFIHRPYQSMGRLNGYDYCSCGST
jgi:hypothetical protein